MNRLNASVASVAILSAGLMAACGGGAVGALPNYSTLTPEAACTALKGLEIPAEQIGLETSGGKVQSTEFFAANPDKTTGAYCQVQGKITSVDPSAQPIQFQASLPTIWNQKMAHLGGGGFNGSIPDVSSAASGGAAGVPPLSKSYVVFSSDSGHSSKGPAALAWQDGSFAMNDEQLRNFSGDQLKKTRDAALFVVRVRYAAMPKKTYFFGGSEGGREAFDVVQRFPADYDGVVSFFPAYSWTSLFLKLNEVGRAQHLNGATGFFGSAKAQRLHDAQIGACDGLDGVQDGLISNVAACNFIASAIRCPSGIDAGDTCLSDPQLNTLATLQSRSAFPIPLANGINSMGGYSIGTNFVSPFYSLGLPTYSQPPTIDQLGTAYRLGDEFIRYFIMKDPSADVLNFDPYLPGKYQDRLIEVSNLLDRTSVTAAKNFIAKGGKLILVHGQSDSIIPTQSSVDYYQRLVSEYGQETINKFMRFYLIPGYGHGDGSFIASVPTLDMLEGWVEQGTPPSAITVTDLIPTNGGRTRPACEYPAWAKYTGSGDVNAASSFTCVSE